MSIDKREVALIIEGIVNLIVGLMIIFCGVLAVLYSLRAILWCWEFHPVLGYLITATCFLIPIYLVNRRNPWD